jgi:hypothetical protein
VEKGILWGIGNGATTQIIQDQWIPSIPPCLVKPLVPLSDGQTVASLITSKAWNEQVVRDTFSEDIADIILWILIS